jgi:hypothetical protein
MARMTPEEKARKLVEKIKQDVIKGAGAGINAALFFYKARVIEALNVVAPTRKVTINGNITKVATTRALKNAPMRKVTGRAQKSVTSEMRGALAGVVGMNARSDANFNYPKYHEIVDPARIMSGQHQSLIPTYNRYKKEIWTIVGKQVKFQIGG